MKKIISIIFVFFLCCIVNACSLSNTNDNDWHTHNVNIIKQQFGEFNYVNANNIKNDDFVYIKSKSELSKFVDVDDPEYNRFKNYDDNYFYSRTLIVVTFIDNDNYDYSNTTDIFSNNSSTNEDSIIKIERYIHDFLSYSNDKSIYVTAILEITGSLDPSKVKVKIDDCENSKYSLFNNDWRYYAINIKNLNYYKYDGSNLDGSEYITYVRDYKHWSNLLKSVEGDNSHINRYSEQYFADQSLILIALYGSFENNYCFPELKGNILELNYRKEFNDSSESNYCLIVIECNRRIYDEEIDYYNFVLNKNTTE